MNDEKETATGLRFTEKARLTHENKCLHDRIDSLVKFKVSFFEAQHELVELQDKLSMLEQQLSLGKLKERVFSSLSEDDQDDIHTDEILKFFHDSFSALSYQDIVMCLLQSTEQKSLEVTARIKADEKKMYYALDKVDKQANAELIERHETEGELVEKERFIIFNRKYLSLIVKFDSGFDDYKNMKDFFEIIVLGSNARIEALFKREELENLRKNIYKIFRKTNQSFMEMQDSANEQTIAISELNLTFEKRLKEMLSHMNVPEKHLKLLTMLFDDSRSELNLLLTTSLAMDESFLSSMKTLEQAYAKKYVDDA